MTNLSKRRFLKLSAYSAPLILGSVSIANAIGAEHPIKMNNPSCAPCYCAPCGQSGEKSEEECVLKRLKCKNEENSET